MKAAYIEERKRREEFIRAYVQANMQHSPAKATAYAKRIWDRERSINKKH